MGSVVFVVVATAFVSGPLVGVELASDDRWANFSPGEGEATVGNATLPDSATIERGDFGSNTYYLRVPSATVEVLSVTGQPMLNYRVQIDGLGYQRGSVHFLSERNVGTYELGMDSEDFEAESITESEYEGTLTVTLRYGDTEETLAERTVPIEVVE